MPTITANPFNSTASPWEQTSLDRQFNSTASPWEGISLARVPYAGCLSIGILGQVIVAAMPLLIALNEITRPVSCARLLTPKSITGFIEWSIADFCDRPDAPSDPIPLDFDLPLLAAGRLS